MGCNGSCCAVFYYRYTPDEIRAQIDAGTAPDEAPYIADMLIPLSLEEAQARAEQFGLRRPVPHEKWPNESPLYTCRYWDEETRLCTAYESRPPMCSNYPYNKVCEHCGWNNDDSETPLDKVLQLVSY